MRSSLLVVRMSDRWCLEAMQKPKLLEITGRAFG